MTSPKMPAPPRLRGNPWAVLSITCLGYFITILNSTSVSIAVPSIQAEFDANLNEVLWVVGGYVLALAALVITAGRLGDLLGPRTTFLTGIVGFTVASALCGLSATPWQLIIARVFQGVGAALVIPQALTITTLVFPPARRGIATAVWGVMAGLAGVAGPTLGGFLASNVGWRSIFLVNVPIGMSVAVLTLLLVPSRHQRYARRLNVPGVILAGAALGAITFGLLEGRHYGWGTVTSFLTIPIIIGTGCALLTAFLISQRYVREPLVPPRLFGNRTFTLMSMVMAAVGMSVITLSLTMTFYLQTVLDLSAADAGLTLAPWAAGMLIGFPIIGRLTDRFGGQSVLLFGLTCYAAGLAVVGLLTQPDTNRYALLVALALLGLMQAAVFGPVTTLAMWRVPVELTGAASGVFNAIRQLGTLLGVSVMGALLQGRLDASIRDAARANAERLPGSCDGGCRNSFVDAASEAATRGDGARIALPHDVPADLAERMRQLAESAYGTAFSAAGSFTLLSCAGIVALATIGTFLHRRTREPDPEPDLATDH